MPFRPRVIENCLQDKFCFSPATGHGSDHPWYELRLLGLPPIRTKVSHSKREIRAELESKIAKQLRVRTAFFRRMIGCQEDYDDYCRQVREDPYPPWEFIVLR